MPKKNGYSEKDLPTYRGPKAVDHCANCGTEVSTRGRAPKKLGKRYCVKQECQAAKHAALREARRPTEARQAPTACSSCSAPMSPRPWRSEDALGRFCRKVRCQGRRDEVRAGGGGAAHAEALARLEEMQDRWAVTLSAVAQPRMKCPTCGLTDAVKGFGHLNELDAPCHGTLSDIGKGHKVNWGAIFAVLWPNQRGYDPA